MNRCTEFHKECIALNDLLLEWHDAVKAYGHRPPGSIE